MKITVFLLFFDENASFDICDLFLHNGCDYSQYCQLRLQRVRQGPVSAGPAEGGSVTEQT